MDRKISLLNASQIKLLACFCMLADHIGYFLLPEVIFLRIIGRLTMPIFAYFVAEGYLHTKSVKRYGLRLFLFAIFYQPIFALCMHTNTFSIFSTLFLGLLSIIVSAYVRQKSSSSLLSYLSAAGVILLGFWIPCEYQAYGVAMVYTAYLFRKKPYALVMSWLLLNLAYAIPYLPELPIQVFSMLALLFIFLYNGERGEINKWFFYCFYCLHIPLLALLAWYLA